MVHFHYAFLTIGMCLGLRTFIDNLVGAVIWTSNTNKRDEILSEGYSSPFSRYVNGLCDKSVNRKLESREGQAFPRSNEAVIDVLESLDMYWNLIYVETSEFDTSIVLLRSR